MGMFLAALLSDNKAITFIRVHILFSQNLQNLKKKTNAGGAKLEENEVYEGISAMSPKISTG